MGDRQEKIIVVKWILPSLCLLVALVVLLINFSVAGQKKAVKEVNSMIIRMAEEYAADVNWEINRMTYVGTPMAAMMLYGSHSEQKEALLIAQTLVNYSDAYMIVLSDLYGKGVTHDGKTVNLAAEPYYAGKECDKQYYVYAEKESLTGGEAIVSVIPVCRDGKLISVMYMFYPMERVRDLFYDFSLYGQSIMMMSLEDGTIVSTGGTDLSFMDGEDNVLDLLNDSTGANKLPELQRRMEISGTGTVRAERNMQDRCIAFVPLKINKWYIGIGVNQDYIDRQVKLEWKDTRGIMNALIVILSGFVLAIASISIIVRIRYSQRSKLLVTKADTDLLTDLYNKMATEREIKDYLVKNPNAKAIMFLLDIDNFKKINDTKGHAFGDEVLKAIGIRLQTAFRVSDIVGRTGGDEFTVFLKDITDESVVEKEMKKLTNVFLDFTLGEYVKYSVTASIGCACYPNDATTFESLYKAADSGLYLAKKRGKNQIARCEKET